MKISRFSNFALAVVTAGGGCAATLRAQDSYELPPLSITADRVANETPVSTFAMPVSALQYEPRVDIQARNFAEAQADVTIRGGIFENTGFKLGALSVYDPQTGHYFAELPVAPAMLASPQVLTGADNAIQGFNAEVGTIAYGWSPIAQRGEASVAFGEYDTNRQDIYQGITFPATAGGLTVGADISAARSESDGSIPNGDHDFKRVAGRVQLRGAHSQTDFFAGWQKKFFGWPNLYTPFGVNETENLENELYAVNHRVALEGDNYWQIGAYYRRNYDDYEYNRFVPGQFNPYQHTTHVRSIALDGRQGSGSWAVDYSAQAMADSLESTALTFGNFHTRDYYKVSVVPEYSVGTSSGQLTVRAGATYDDTNRDGSAVSPIAEIALKTSASTRLYAQYAESTQVPTYTALNSAPTSGLFRGNPNLGRETSRNLEAGASFAVDTWTVQTAVFYRWDDDLVDWTYAQNVNARSANAVDIGMAGFEVVAATHQPRWDLVLGYTYLDKNADYGSATVTASFYALNFARHRFTAAIVGRLGAGFEVRMDNEYRIQEPNALRTVGGDEAWLSGIGLYYLPPRWRGLELSFRVDNLWDSDFQDVPSVPAARRQWIAGATYHW